MCLFVIGTSFILRKFINGFKLVLYIMSLVMAFMLIGNALKAALDMKS
tara:strand:- start:1033 stop:1176 length:144 start_codon:yes stop_codon:yes gene_type:complete